VGPVDESGRLLRLVQGHLKAEVYNEILLRFPVVAQEVQLLAAVVVGAGEARSLPRTCPQQTVLVVG
jgi:hypothetical protein